MADRPILLFPKASHVTYQPRQGGPQKGFNKPSKAVQSQRIDGMFRRINEAFDERRIEVQQSADNAAPEMVLVFETRGTIDEFFKAVKNIPELKYLGDFEKEFEAKDDFKYDSDPSKPITGKLYFVLANSAALIQLRSLWQTWKTKKQNFRTGETKWKQLFNLLYDIRVWGIKDRVEETGILIDWQERINRNEEIIPFEVELWFRKSKNQRDLNVGKIRELLNEFEGELVYETVIEEISYHGLLIKAPISIFDNLLNDTQIRFFKSSDIMHLRPVGQSIIKITEDTEVESHEKALVKAEGLLPPVIALLDGMPMQNHYYLAGRVDVYDPDNFQENYPVTVRQHGTGMASIIIHGDLNDDNEPLKSTLLVRPVMRSHQVLGEYEEYIPENYLLVDLIHRSVKEIMEDETLNKSIRVFNISLGDKFRIFDTLLSPWAKLLDWLADRYNILFVVSAGNISEDISFDNLEDTFDNILSNGDLLKKASLKQFYAKNRFRKIISPAESINALTIGASHSDSCQNIQLNDRINLFENDSLLSPISRMGLGYRKSIKPDILAKGGKMLYRRTFGSDNLKCLFSQTRLPPGIMVASPFGGINGVAYTKGTSNSAALVSHVIGKTYENFISNEELRQIVDQNYFPVVAKSLMVHSASWDEDVFNFINSTIETRENKRDVATRFLGYGKIDASRIIQCTDKRVTLIGFGTLKPESAWVYELPLPNSLSGRTEWKKVVATLAWFTPINCDNLIYRTHKLWFDFPNSDIDSKLKATRLFYNDDTVRRGTVQHEVFYGDKATAFADNSNLKIKVNCKTDAIKYDLLTTAKRRELKAIKYGLVVTLEVDPELPVDIYNEILIRIKQPVRV